MYKRETTHVRWLSATFPSHMTSSHSIPAAKSSVSVGHWLPCFCFYICSLLESAKSFESFNLKFLVTFEKISYRSPYCVETRLRLWMFTLRFLNGLSGSWRGKRDWRRHITRWTFNVVNEWKHLNNQLFDQKRPSIKYLHNCRDCRDKETVQQNLHKRLNIRKICSKVVLKNLTPEQKESQINICADILKTIKEKLKLL